MTVTALPVSRLSYLATCVWTRKFRAKFLAITLDQLAENARLHCTCTCQAGVQICCINTVVASASNLAGGQQTTFLKR